ncbi:MAG: hypothetical protein BGN92_13220 [Sphingobacteriales bacterium 41-5]|nr:MAG: hypothetical protein BGN92_13220 [Sphingobacteriales bacterium 41-5]
MKNLYFFLAITIMTALSASCHAQKMMTNINDAKKLEDNKKQFVGKPLSNLLKEIGPSIKYYFGNPDNRGESIVGTNFKFYFISKSDYEKTNKKIKHPISIGVSFMIEPNNKRKPVPIGGTEEAWTEKETKEYGDMIIINVWVSGKD